MEVLTKPKRKVDAKIDTKLLNQIIDFNILECDLDQKEEEKLRVIITRDTAPISLCTAIKLVSTSDEACLFQTYLKETRKHVLNLKGHPTLQKVYKKQFAKKLEPILKRLSPDWNYIEYKRYLRSN